LSKERPIKIITTEDGSHSLLYEEIEETYHSVHGAIQESNHVYIEAGLNYWLDMHVKSADVNILEYGFGTGLNALLTLLKTEGRIMVSYHTLEKYPLSRNITESLNYDVILNSPEAFNKIHRAKWDVENSISQNFSIKKIEVDFLDYVADKYYDIIYFDAFAPGKQPELWVKPVFDRCYQLLNKGGVLVTYSARGQLKRDLKSIGFTVESLPGPPGKFEITRAIK
jgi:tRNA U34 5-methylaminomethyl-2-thiouridine-forming methyltransferase MnmC